jgi:hypothetical protein
MDNDLDLFSWVPCYAKRVRQFSINSFYSVLVQRKGCRKRIGEPGRSRWPIGISAKRARLSRGPGASRLASQSQAGQHDCNPAHDVRRDFDFQLHAFTAGLGDEAELAFAVDE